MNTDAPRGGSVRGGGGSCGRCGGGGGGYGYGRRGGDVGGAWSWSLIRAKIKGAPKTSRDI